MRFYEKRIVLILFITLLVSIGIYTIIIVNKNKQKNLNYKESSYYKTFGESCLDKVTDAYLRDVCEKINNKTERDSCYYKEGVSTGYGRICKLVEDKTLKQRCFIEVNITLSNNRTLKQRAEKYNPMVRQI